MVRDENSTPSSNQYVHDEKFYRYIQKGAARSARVIAPLILQRLQVRSVLDVGCGTGAWLAEYSRLGIPLCLGVDGDYVRQSFLLVPPTNFMPVNVSQPFDLGQRFDLVQCLEVAEHIDPAASSTLIENLAKHGDFVMFSAATPGQGGENHLNEQSYEFWRAIFAERGYSPYDFLRPRLQGKKAVEIWYRHNTILYVADCARARLTDDIAATKVPESRSIANVAGYIYRFRCRMLAMLPVAWVSRLAVLKRHCIMLARAIVRRDSSSG